MATVLFVAPLLAAHLLGMGHVREVRGHGLVVRAQASERRGVTEADIQIRARGRTQAIHVSTAGVGADMLLASLAIVDVNFDGHPDVTVVREFGAKWESLEAFVYDPARGLFSSGSPIARAIGRLANATFDAAHKTITTRDIGPSSPSRVTYAIEGARLREIASCRFLNPIDEHTGTLVRNQHGKTTFTHVRLGASDVDPCD